MTVDDRNDPVTDDAEAARPTVTPSYCPNCNRPLPTKQRGVPERCLFCGEPNPGPEASTEEPDSDAGDSGLSDEDSSEEPMAADVYDPPLDTSSTLMDYDAAFDAPNDGGNSWKIKLLTMPIIFLVAVPTVFLGLGRTSLQEPDEPRFAEASRQMLASGDYLTPYFNGEAHYDASILFYQMQAAAFREFGVSEYGARLPSALAGLGCLWLVYLIGRKLFSARTGMLGALVLGTTFRFVLSSRNGLTDVPLLFFVLLSLYGFIRAADTDPPGGWFALLGWLGVSLGMLTQGAAGLLPIIVWLPYLVLTGRLGGLRRLRFSTGVLLTLVIVLPWYLYMAWTHGRGFVELAVLSELMARYAPTGAETVEWGPLFYLTVWASDAMPWTLYAVAAVVAAVLGGSQLTPAYRRGAALCVIWFVVVLVICTLSAEKLPHYLLPLYPAGALLVGMLFDRAIDKPRESGPWVGVANWLTALGLLVLAGLISWLLQRRFGLPVVSLAMAVPAALALGSIFMVIFQRGGQPIWNFGVVVPVFALGYGLLAVNVAPDHLERFKPVRPLATLAAAQQGDDRQLGLYGDRSQGFVFYTGQNVEWLGSADEAASFLSEDGLRLCVLRFNDLEDIRSRYTGVLYQLATQQRQSVQFADLFSDDSDNDWTTLVLLSNQPPK